MKILQTVLLFLLACMPAFAATYSITPSTSMATIQADLATAGPNTYNFSAGTYTQITGTLTFPCNTGNVYQGAASAFVPGVANSPGTVLNASFTGSNLIRVTGTSASTVGCKIDGFWFENQNVYVQPPVSGLLFTHNRISGINGSVKGSGNTTSWSAIYVDNGTASDIANSTFQYNTFGPSCTDVDATTGTDYGGTCGGITIHGSNVGLTVIDNNVSGQIEEFFHTLAQGTNGQISKNLVIENNDLGFVHRIGIELQQQDVQNAVVQYNDMHDEFNPAQFSFLISAACCGSAGGSTTPGVVINDNVLFNNVALSSGETYNVGYGIELWGFGSQATGNLLQAQHFANAIALGGFSSGPSSGMKATGNTIQGNITAPNCEMGGTAPSCTFAGTSTIAPNTGSSTISAQVSQAPAIWLSNGVFTLDESAANTSVWYTTDGSTPVPGQGTAKLYAAPFQAATTTTVKAVGMWGSGANPYSYASGYGYTTSQVISSTFTVIPPPPPPPPAPVCTSVQTGFTLTVTCTGVL